MSLSGTGTNAVTVSPASLAFGTVAVGVTSASQAVTVSNHQSVAITLSASIGGASPGDFAIEGPGSTCGLTLAAKADCAYEVTFTPAAAKSYGARLNISDSPDTRSPHSVGLSGKGA